MDPVVKTRQGFVRGSAADGVFSFKGIPYAAPPFGPNRFRPPQPAPPWPGEREALQYGPTAPKAPYAPPLDKLIPENFIPGEDCLNLNIWTPDVGRSGLPVMVWIHGGAFLNGSGSAGFADGTPFARDGVVCVTINYRLGADGFLYLDDGIANLGLLDQIAALAWVRENIEAFGGDPDNVTIFGPSAGAMSICALMAMPSSHGLYRRAIAQSGAGHHVLSTATALRVGRRLAEKLGVQPTRASIAEVPIERLVSVQQEMRTEISGNLDLWGEAARNGMPFEPVIDGTLLADRPIDVIAAGLGAKCDVMVGTNTDEVGLYIVPSGMIDLIDEHLLADRIAAFDLPVEETIAIYRKARPAAAPGDLLSAVMTDWNFRIPAIRIAEAALRLNAGAAFVYEFAWKPPAFNGRIGACHALEAPFIFDNLHAVKSEILWDSHPPQEIADAMHAAWIRFAKSGDPGWPPYDLTRRATMRFDIASHILNDPRAGERLFWEGRR